jgi:hypothetical protein
MLMADNSGSAAMGVLVGAILVAVLAFGGFMIFNNLSAGADAPSVTIGSGR